MGQAMASDQGDEIDIAERFTSYRNRLIPYIHYLRNGQSVHDTNEDCFVSGISDRFHKVVLVWTARGRTAARTLSGIEVFGVRDGRITDVWNTPYSTQSWG